tara:strand:+ start:152 stop:460 length:309 start_codon:yes stop_codon:yes gene_type:complete
MNYVIFCDDLFLNRSATSVFTVVWQDKLIIPVVLGSTDVIAILDHIDDKSNKLESRFLQLVINSFIKMATNNPLYFVEYDINTRAINWVNSIALNTIEEYSK